MVVRALVEAPAFNAPLEDSDAELVAAARADPAAFLALYDRYFDRVRGYVRLRVRSEAVCEDVTSEVFTSALAGLNRLRREGSFAGWLFQIARNAVHDVHRSPSAEAIPDSLASQQDLRFGAEEQALQRERLQQLRLLVGALPPEQQHLLGLRYGAGLDYEAIGVVVGGSAGAVRVRVHRILEELRGRYPDDSA